MSEAISDYIYRYNCNIPEAFTTFYSHVSLAITVPANIVFLIMFIVFCMCAQCTLLFK